VWPLTAVALGAAGAAFPLSTAAVLAAVAAIVLAIAVPRATAGLTALVVMFIRPIEHVVQISAVGYLDEGLVVLCLVTMPLRRVIAREPLRSLPGQWWFALFLICGLLSGLFLQVPLSITLTGAFIIAKGLLFGWAVAQLDWTEQHIAVAVRVGAVLIVLCLATAAANLAMPGAWNAVMASDANAVEARSVLPSLIGPFTHPIDLGQFMAMSFVAIAAWRAVVRKSMWTLALLTATGLGALGTARRTAAGSIVAAWLWLQAKMRNTAILIGLLACLPVLVVVLSGPLTTVVAATYNTYVGNATREARTVLTVDSFDVAATHFPGGAGFGRFGSATAANNYSPEYEARGYPYVWGLGRTEEDGRFLTDTEWPAIIGETGFFGALAYALGLVCAYRAGVRAWSRADSPLVRWVGLTSAGWLIASLVQSVGTVTFTGPPTYGLLFGIFGVVAALSARIPSEGPSGRETARADVVGAGAA
jgi:hypothetical protein